MSTDDQTNIDDLREELEQKDERISELEQQMHEIAAAVEQPEKMTPTKDGTGISRRELLGAALGGSVLGLGGAAASQELSDSAQAAGSPAPDVGTPNDRVDVFGAEIDSNSVSTDKLSTTPTLTHRATLSDTSLGSPHDIEIRDGLGLIPGKSGNASLVGLYPRTSPSVLGTDTGFTDANTVAAYPGRNEPQMWVIVDKNNIYTATADRDGNVFTVDSNALPADYGNGAAWYKGDPSQPLSIWVACKNGSVVAYDVSDFDTISQTTSYTPNSASPHDVASFGTRVVIVNQKDGASPKVEIINAINGTSTAIGSTLSTDGSLNTSTLNGANRVETYGHYAVVASNFAGTLATVDCSNYSSPSLADSVSTAQSNPSGLSVVGDYAITAATDTVEIWDISDPTSISRVSSHTVSGNADHDVAVDGRWLYVTGQASNELQVYELGFEYATTQRAQDLAHGSA